MASPVVDYTSLDYDSLKEALKKYAQEKYGNEGWTDFNDNQFAVMLLELVAYTGDLAFFQVNALVKEGIIALLTREQNLRNIGRSLDFAISSAQASTGQLVCTFNVPDLPYNLPKEFMFGTDDAADQVIFQPKSDTLITTSPQTIDVVEGQGSTNELIGTSDGTQNQSYSLSNKPMIDGTLTVLVGGIAWSAVTNVSDSGPLDTHYLIETDEDDQTSIVFGDGVNGLVPPSTQEIRATYKAGGGERGNTAKNTVTKIVTPSTTVLTCNNPVKMSGGQDKPTVTQAKRALTASLSTLKRAVTDLDFAKLAVNVAGVAKASAEPGSSTNEVTLYIAPTGGGQPSDTLKNNVVSAFKTSKMLGTKIVPGGPYYLNLSMTIDLDVLDTARQGDTSALIRAKLLEALKFDNVDFAGILKLQSIYLLLDPADTQGVDSIFVRKLQGISEVRTKFGVGNTGNGTFVTPVQNSNSSTLQNDIQVSDITGTTKIDVTRRQRGTVTDLNDTTITDNTVLLTPGALIGLSLIPDEDLGGTPLVITGNTENTIAVAGGLLARTSKEATYSIALGVDSAFVMADTAISFNSLSTVTVVDPTGFVNGDRVVIVDSVGVAKQYFTGTITVAGSVVTLPQTPVVHVAGDRLVKLYMPPDLSWSFGMIKGGTAWVVGDKWFVDTFATLGDIKVRRQDIVQLLTGNLTIRATGGIVV